MTTTRRTGAPASRGRAPVQQLRLKLVVFALLCALPVYGSALLWVRQGMMIPAIALTVMSLFAFVLYRHDKHQAGNGGQRTPETAASARRKMCCTRSSCWAAGRAHYWRNRCFATRPARCLFRSCSG